MVSGGTITTRTPRRAQRRGARRGRHPLDPIMEAEHQEEWAEAEQDARPPWQRCIKQNGPCGRPGSSKTTCVWPGNTSEPAQEPDLAMEVNDVRRWYVSDVAEQDIGSPIAPDPSTAAAKSAEPVAATSSFVCFCDQHQAMTAMMDVGNGSRHFYRGGCRPRAKRSLTAVPPRHWHPSAPWSGSCS